MEIFVPWNRGGGGGKNVGEIVKMINSNIIVKMEMNFALSPKCHFMVMNSISMKMSIEAQPQLEQQQISNEYFPAQNPYSRFGIHHRARLGVGAGRFL